MSSFDLAAVELDQREHSRERGCRLLLVWAALEHCLMDDLTRLEGLSRQVERVAEREQRGDTQRGARRRLVDGEAGCFDCSADVAEQAERTYGRDADLDRGQAVRQRPVVGALLR